MVVMETEINNGTITKSSRRPSTGMRSGIRSTGRSKLPTVIPIRIRCSKWSSFVCICCH